VEEYHKALKTGCAMEQRQLQSAQGLLAFSAEFSQSGTKEAGKSFNFSEGVKKVSTTF
jgi:hypothetical protein